MPIKDKFLSHLKRDLSIDWNGKILSTRSVILDVLYLLGVSIDETKYSHADGFEKFLKENEVSVKLIKERIEDKS